MTSPQFRGLRAKVGGLTKSRPADDPELADTKHRLQEQSFVEAIEKALAKAPAMTDDLRQKIIGLLS